MFARKMLQRGVAIGKVAELVCEIVYKIKTTYQILSRKWLMFSLAVRTGLEPATPCVTGMYSNQTELPDHRVSELVSKTGCKNRTLFSFNQEKNKS